MPRLVASGIACSCAPLLIPARDSCVGTTHSRAPDPLQLFAAAAEQAECCELNTHAVGAYASDRRFCAIPPSELEVGRDNALPNSREILQATFKESQL